MAVQEHLSRSRMYNDNDFVSKTYAYFLFVGFTDVNVILVGCVTMMGLEKNTVPLKRAGPSQKILEIWIDLACRYEVTKAFP